MTLLQKRLQPSSRTATMSSLKLIAARFVAKHCQLADLNYLPDELSCFVRHHMDKTRQIELWNGQVIRYYSTMRMADEYNYNSKGELHGRRISWRQNGLQWREETYRNGKLHGPMFVFHINGRLAKCCLFSRGQRAKCQHWHIDGRAFSCNEYNTM